VSGRRSTGRASGRGSDRAEGADAVERAGSADGAAGVDSRDWVDVDRATPSLVAISDTVRPPSSWSMVAMRGAWSTLATA